MAKQKMRETVLEQSKQENRNEEEKLPCRTGGFFDPIYHNTGSFGRVQGADGGKSEEIQIEHLDGKVRRMVGRSFWIGRMAAATTEPGMLSRWKNI